MAQDPVHLDRTIRNGISNKKGQPAPPFSPERKAIPRNDLQALKKQLNQPAVPSRTSKPHFARNNLSSQ